MVKIDTFTSYAEAKRTHDLLTKTIELCHDREDLETLWNESQDTIRKLCNFYEDNAEAIRLSITLMFKHKAKLIKKEKEYF